MQSDAVTNQVSALSVVYNSFQDQELRDTKRKLVDTTLELERARMATEDARGGAMRARASDPNRVSDPLMSDTILATAMTRAPGCVTPVHTLAALRLGSALSGLLANCDDPRVGEFFKDRFAAWSRGIDERWPENA